MKISTIAALLFFQLFFLKTALSQENANVAIGETGLWNGLYLKVKLSKNLGYYGEHHYRLRNSEDNLHDFIGRNRQFYNRAGLQIYFNPYFEAVIGPTLVLNFSPRPGDDGFENVTLEPRIWHQWLFSMPSMGRVKLYHQFRFEHRWKRDNTIGSQHYFTHRYRYKFFAYIPINKKEINPGTLYFSPSAEIFMHSGRSIVFNPFEDFRTYNGFGYVLNGNVTLFAGHMWTLGQVPTGFQYKTSHIIRLNAFIGLDGRKLENRLPLINLGY